MFDETTMVRAGKIVPYKPATKEQLKDLENRQKAARDFSHTTKEAFDKEPRTEWPKMPSYGFGI